SPLVNHEGATENETQGESPAPYLRSQRRYKIRGQSVKQISLMPGRGTTCHLSPPSCRIQQPMLKLLFDVGHVPGTCYIFLC
ncbi:unnamed protein product, partial [Ascophyllum nodosum]